MGSFTINPIYDPTVTALKTSNPTLYADYISAVQTAVQFFEQHFTNPITVNISFGRGEDDNKSISGVGGSTTEVASYTYATATDEIC